MRPSASASSLLRRQTALRGSLVPPRLTIIEPARPLRVRYASQLTTHGSSSSPGAPRYPSDNDYSNSTMYAFGYLSRIVRYLLYGVLTLGGVSLATFEGLHLYVEHVCLAAPARDALTEGEDEYGWIAENIGWTGGAKGGTDPRLGFKARHALRGAWICQEWGAGGSGTVGKGTSAGIHPDFVAARGMIGSQGSQQGIRKGVDRGYELADEFIDLAIREAQKRGLVFPPTLSSLRPAGPPAPTGGVASSVPQGDPAVLDLLLLKAGVLERINTIDSLLHAKDLYEQVLSAVDHSAAQHSAAHHARVIRLAGKVGDLSARTGNGGEAQKWWTWGLGRAGVEVGTGVVREVVAEVKKDVKEVKGWFGRTKASAKEGSAAMVQIHPAQPDSVLRPPVLRAAITLLVSSSAHFATSNSLRSASAIQSLALSYLPSSHPLFTPTSSTAAAALHDTWLAQRASLLQLHHGSVLHAQKGGQSDGTPLELVNAAVDGAEHTIAALQPLPSAYSTPRSNALAQPAKLLRRDALLTGAEAAYTRAVFLERSAGASSNSKDVQTLEQAAEGFERAMALSSLESGVERKGESEELGRGDDWAKYYRGFVRVRGKLATALGHEAKKQ